MDAENDKGGGVAGGGEWKVFLYAKRTCLKVLLGMITFRETVVVKCR